MKSRSLDATQSTNISRPDAGDNFYRKASKHPLLSKSEEEICFQQLDTRLRAWIAALLMIPSIEPSLRQAFPHKVTPADSPKAISPSDTESAKSNRAEKSPLTIEEIRNSYPCFARLSKITDQLLKDSNVPEISRNELQSAQRQTAQLRESITAKNLRLVIKIAHEHNFLKLPMMDVIQEGNLGLLTAIERYRLSHGTRFSTYAWWWIKQSITSYVRRQGGIVRKPESVVDQIVKVVSRFRGAAEYSQNHAVQRVAEDAEISQTEVNNLLQLAKPDISLEQPFETATQGNLEMYTDTISDTPDSIVITDKRLDNLLSRLPDRLRHIIILRFGLFKSRSLTNGEIGETLGVSAERVRQLESQALDLLKQELQ